MGARTDMSNNNSTTTTEEVGTANTSTKLTSWKARAARFRVRRDSSGGGNTGRPPSPEGMGECAESNGSLQAQRNKNKKNWRGSLKNLLPKERKESDEPGNQSTSESPVPVEVAKDSRNDLYEWQDPSERDRAIQVMQRKQRTKERDGFCRRVDFYDGQVLCVDGKPSYELGNYLGGGVAGVVYECNRLLPPSEYPVRQGNVTEDAPIRMIIPEQPSAARTTSFICGDASTVDFETQRSKMSRATTSSSYQQGVDSDQATVENLNASIERMAMDVEIETTNNADAVLIDQPDAPSRSKHAAKAAAASSKWFMEETVAIKILNPVGFRIMTADQVEGAVVVKEGDPMSNEIQQGTVPMEDRHVWWLVNPNSRNLQTLQRYNNKRLEGTLKKSRDVDRGTNERGLRLSLVAAFMDSRGQLKELPLTRCIEVWGHISFDATDNEFEEMLEAIERVNAGQAPSPAPSCVPASDSSGSQLTLGSQTMENIPLSPAKTGLYRAAVSSRATVFCDALDAFIALPAVPPKYLRWLRQRRAATKEIRNMMLIGRHRNVVHLYEVLEYIQDSKSTMFLILELVRGGELFDLISNNSNGGKRGIDIESEMEMRKFFLELASGIHYCHANGIAHRDLKPENLLVHTGVTESTLKIADFGLSATFAIRDDETIRDSVASPAISPFGSPAKGDVSVFTIPTIESNPGLPAARSNSFSSSFSALGQQALTLLTCGNVEDVNWCGPNAAGAPLINAIPSPLKRMTSIVGSPHYVAPEIIMQSDGISRRKKGAVGYDGTKADVWSAGVILYAMLYRSLPFGEDLLRCPRYQSFCKWYNQARREGGRRSSAVAALSPIITDTDEDDMLGPHWFFPSHTSVESRDLIVAMLNPNPNDRLSIDFVLQHPWLKKERISLSRSSS